MKLRSKITLTLIASGLTLSLAIISVFIFWSRYEITNKVIESFKIKNIAISNQIDSFLKNRVSELYLINKHVYFDYINNKNNQINQKLFLKRNELKYFENFQIYDLKGIKIIDTNRTSIGEKRLFEKELFNHSPHDTNLSYKYDHYSKEEMISLTQYILNENEEPIGIIIGNIPQKTITNIIYSNFTEGEKQKIDLIRDNGQILFSNNNLDIYAVDTLNEIKQNLLKSKDGFLFVQDENLFKAYAKSSFNISNSFNTWYMLISIDKNSAYAPIYKRALFFGILTLFIISIFSYLSYRISKSLTKNIEVATEAISELGKGNFNNLKNIPVSDDEIGILISNIKSMSEEINFLIEYQKNKSQMIAVGKMAGSIAHEINNPIHLMSNQIKQIEKILQRNSIHIPDTTDKQKLHKNFQNIYETTKRIKKTILKLKDLTNENIIDSLSEVSIYSFLDEAMRNQNSILSKSVIEFSYEIEKTEHNFQCRPPQITQVIESIINNAIEATSFSDEKWIKVNCYEKNDFYLIEITNSGELIDKHKADNIFSPTYTMKNNVMRVGMNLAISKSILDSFGGNIYLDLSKSNTTFIISMPIAKNIPKENETSNAA